MVNNLKQNQLLTWFIEYKIENPGYSDFSNLGVNTSFNFSTSNTAPISHGANA